MTWDLEAARVRIGLPQDDTTQDVQLQAALDVALAAAESYCDRLFLRGQQAETFRQPARSITVRRYPLVQLLGLMPPQPWPPGDPPVQDPVPAGWQFDGPRGIVYLCGGAAGVAPVGSAPAPYGAGGFVLTYSGGYEATALPKDLEAALWLAFDAVWYATPGMGAAAGTNTAGAPVKSFGIDGMSVSYDNAAGGASAGSAPGAWGLLPATAVALLQFYRAESAALGA